MHLNSSSSIIFIIFLSTVVTFVAYISLSHKIQNIYFDNNISSFKGYIIGEEMEYEVDIPSALYPTIVLIDSPTIHSKIRNVIGSIHKHHSKGKVNIVLFGIRLTPEIKSEINFWDRVQLIDVEQTFLLSAMPLKEIDEMKLIQGWKPFIIRYSLEHYKTIIYLNENIEVTNPINHKAIKKFYQDGNAFFFQFCYKNDLFNYVDIMLLSLESEIYRNFIVPLLECKKRECSKQKEINTKLQSMIITKCKPVNEISFVKVVNYDDKDYTSNRCNIHMRDDFLYSSLQLPGVNKDVFKRPKSMKRKKGDKRIHIALGIPTTSKKLQSTEINTLPLVRILGRGLAYSIQMSDKNKHAGFLYKIYVAYDEHDSFFENTKIRKEIKQHIGNILKERPFQMTMIKVKNTRGWVPVIWNFLFQQAMEDGADYFFQMNDDIKVATRNWGEILHNLFQQSPYTPGFGVIGPKDIDNEETMTQAIVSKVHYKIFGYLYPSVFKNWYSDDWIGLLYRPFEAAFATEKIKVHNTNRVGTRYEACSLDGNGILVKMLDAGRRKINNWLLENHYLHNPVPVLSNDELEQKILMRAMECNSRSNSTLPKHNP
ncbi:hypothetical protein ABK040_015352 [Willaertia magna]